MNTKMLKIGLMAIGGVALVVFIMNLVSHLLFPIMVVGCCLGAFWYFHKKNAPKDDGQV